MSESGEAGDSASLSASESEELDRICDRFEAAWRAGQPLRFEDHLGKTSGPSRAALRAELAAIEFEWRRRSDDRRESFVSDKLHTAGVDQGETAITCSPEIATIGSMVPESEVLGGTLFDWPETKLGEPNDPGAIGGHGGSTLPIRPELIPGYEILGELGRGGMGVVYKARQENLNRIVALKMILTGSHASPAAVSRFLREAETIARLKHPHVVQVYDYGTFEGKPFFSLEFLEGGSLADQLRDGPQSPRQAAETVRVLALAVQVAHDHGIVHRDLKPANVLLSEQGIPKVADFGVAKQDDSVMTLTGEVLGTPSYMSPEQAGGETKRVGPATDVYALGAILYELLTGRSPFKGPSAWETILLVRDSEPVAPRQLQPRQPLDLETICLKCLQKEPSKRYASARELAEDLRRYLAGETILARPVGSITKAGRWCLRNKVVTASLLAVTLSLLTATVVSVAFGLRAERARVAEAARTLGERKAKQDAESANQAARKQLIDISAETGLTAAGRGDHSLALLWFARAAQLATDFPEQEELNRLRYANWRRHVWTPKGAFSSPGFRRGQDRYRALRFSPDGVICWSGRVRLARWSGIAIEVESSRFRSCKPSASPRPGSRRTACWRSAGKTTRSAFSRPRSSRSRKKSRLKVGSTSSNSAVMEDILPGAGSKERGSGTATGKRSRPRYFLYGGPVMTLAFSESGALLATSACDQKARVFRTNSETSAPVFVPVPHNPAEYGISHGGPDRVAPRFADGDRSLLTVERAGGTSDLVWHSSTTGEVLGHGDNLRGADYFSAFDVAPTGNIVVDCWTTMGRLIEARSREVIAAVPIIDRDEDNLCEDVTFSADGEEVVTCGHDMKVKTWSIGQKGRLSLTASSPPILLPHQAVRVALSRDGHHLAVAVWDGSVYLWNRPEGPPVAYKVAAAGATWPMLSPDRHLLLPKGTSFRGGSLRETRVYDADRGEPAGPSLSPGGILIDAAFSPDGSRLALAALTAQSPDERQRQIFLGDGKAGNIQVWDPRLGKRLVGPVPLPAEPRGLAFRPDGLMLAVVCADYRVVLVEADSGAIRHTLDPGIRSRPSNANLWTSNGEARFSPDGRFLLTWELAPILHVWDPDSGRLLQTLKHTERIEHATFNTAFPHLVATGGRDSIAKVWDVTTGQLLAQLPHPRWIQSLAFSPDGMELVTGCDDGMVRSWDWKAAELKRGLLNHSSLFNLDFTAGRRRMVTQGTFLQVSDWRTGTPIGPEWPLLAGVPRWGVVLSAGDRRVIVGGFDGNLVAYDLEAITKRSAGTDEELQMFAELASGRRILSQGNVVSINGDEWTERWAQVRRFLNSRR